MIFSWFWVFKGHRMPCAYYFCMVRICSFHLDKSSCPIKLHENKKNLPRTWKLSGIWATGDLLEALKFMQLSYVSPFNSISEQSGCRAFCFFMMRRKQFPLLYCFLFQVLCCLCLNWVYQTNLKWLWKNSQESWSLKIINAERKKKHKQTFEGSETTYIESMFSCAYYS